MALETGKFHNIRFGRAWKVVNLLHLCSRKNKVAPKMTAISRLRNKVKVFNLLCGCISPLIPFWGKALFTG